MSGRPTPDCIPLELQQAAFAAGYDNINKYCQDKFGLPNKWPYDFFKRKHTQMLPYKRMAKTLSVTPMELAKLIAGGEFRGKIKSEEFETLQAFVDKAQVSRAIVEDCCNQRVDQLCIFSYIEKLDKIGMSLDTFVERHLS